MANENTTPSPGPQPRTVELPQAARALAPKKSMAEIAQMLAENTTAMHAKRTAQPDPSTPPNKGNRPNAATNTNSNSNRSDDRTDQAGRVARSNRRIDPEDADDNEAGTVQRHRADTDADEDQRRKTRTDEIDGEQDDPLDQDGQDDQIDQDDYDDQIDQDDNQIDDDDDPQALEPLEFEIDDDDLVEVGEETVPLGALKKLYQADKHILEQVQKQEEATKEALTERAKAQAAAQQSQGAFNAVLRHVLDTIAQPLVSPPPAELKTTDPQRYIQHLDAYQQDLERIKSTQENLTGAFEEYQRHTKAQRDEWKRAEIQQLRRSIPALQSEKTQEEARNDILAAAQHYGFSPEEVNEAIDHRVYRMAYDAQQYRKLMKQTSRSEVDLTEEKAKSKVRQTRTLRSKGSSAKSRLSAQAKQVRVLKQKAKDSGRPADVAAFLAAQRSG